MNAPSDDPYLGRLLGGKYLLESRLGIGAVGTVYRALHQQLGRAVAVKVLRASMAKDPDVVARFTREARLASRVEHPNVVRVYDCDSEPDGLTYLAMELLEGEELAAIMARGPVLESNRVVSLLGQVLAALGSAHRLGIVHRDLKPENILVLGGTSDDGRPMEIVKVADFGIARVYGESASPAEQITRWGVVSGTPEYMSPEQALADELDGRSDLYACGVILYEIVAGRHPFTGDSPLEILEKHLRDEPLPPSHWRAVDLRLEPIAMRALAKRREDRYPDASTMRAALVAALDAPIAWSNVPAPSVLVQSGPSVIIESAPSVLIESAPSVLIESGPSVIVSTEPSAPSVLIESGPSVIVTSRDEPSVVMPHAAAAEAPSVLVESGPSVVIPASETKPAPAAARPAEKSKSGSGIALALFAVALLSAAVAGVWWFLRGSETDRQATPEPPIATLDAGPAPVVPMRTTPTQRALRRPPMHAPPHATTTTPATH